MISFGGAHCHTCLIMNCESKQLFRSKQTSRSTNLRCQSIQFHAEQSNIVIRRKNSHNYYANLIPVMLSLNSISCQTNAKFVTRNKNCKTTSKQMIKHQLFSQLQFKNEKHKITTCDHTVELSFKNITILFEPFLCLLPDSRNVGISHTKTFYGGNICPPKMT